MKRSNLKSKSNDRVQDARKALERAKNALLARQHSDGAWDFPGDSGPAITAEVVVALHWAKRLNRELADAATNDLLAEQREDGSWPAFPLAARGGLGATARAIAALHVARRDDASSALSKAQDWLDRAGGVNALRKAFDEGDLGLLYLAIAGLADPRTLPVPPVAHLIVPPVRTAIERRFNAYIVTLACELHLIIRRLRGESIGTQTWFDVSARIAAQKALEFYDEFQNEDGSVNELPMQTAMCVAAMFAMGRGHDLRVDRAVAWLERRAVKTAHGASFGVFSSEVWSTANSVHALLAGGASPREPAIVSALSWLMDAQCKTPQSRLCNRQPHVPLVGGWAYQRDNARLPDSDDSAAVLTAMGEALDPRGKSPDKRIDDVLRKRVQASFDRGLAWLRGMQNPDGGYAAYMWGMPSKAPGPGPTTPTRLPSTAREALQFVRQVPPELGDPSTEGLTGRVIECFGIAGARASDPSIIRSLRFLQVQQCDFGGFWGRWLVNYLPTTASVLLGLSAVEADLEIEWVKRARRFLVDHQRPDGGFGEDERSYADPRLAGTARVSMPGLTGLVASALTSIAMNGHRRDENEHAALVSAIDYLIANQRADGTWDDQGWLAPVITPLSFFHYPGSALFYPVAALGRFVVHNDHLGVSDSFNVERMPIDSP